MSHFHRVIAACIFLPLFGASLAQTALPTPAPPQVKLIVIKQGVEGRSYTLGPFDRIELAGSANVRLLQGNEDQVFIAGDAAVQEGVQVSVRQGCLDIRSDAGWKIWPGKRLQVEVTMRRLQELLLSGASDVHAPAAFKAEALNVRISGAGSTRFDDLTAERLDFGISGSGVGVMRGRVELLDVRISGKGKLQAEDLLAHSAKVRISGIGNAELWVSEQLNLNISGVGQIEYWGQPTVTRTTSGIAKVLSRGDRRMPPVPPAPPAIAAPPATPALPAAHSNSSSPAAPQRATGL